MRDGNSFFRFKTDFIFNKLKIARNHKVFCETKNKWYKEFIKEKWLKGKFIKREEENL